MKKEYDVIIEVIAKSGKIETHEKQFDIPINIKTKRKDIEIICVKSKHPEVESTFGFAEKGIDEFFEDMDSEILNKCERYFDCEYNAKLHKKVLK